VRKSCSLVNVIEICVNRYRAKHSVILVTNGYLEHVLVDRQ
jgi:hypothetical protein